MRFNILTALILLYPAETQSRQIDIPAAIKAAYEMGKQDAAYAVDDIGLKRLTINDLERLI